MHVDEDLWPSIAAAAVTASLIALKVGVSLHRVRLRTRRPPREPEVELSL